MGLAIASTGWGLDCIPGPESLVACGLGRTLACLAAVPKLVETFKIVDGHSLVSHSLRSGSVHIWFSVVTLGIWRRMYHHISLGVGGQKVVWSLFPPPLPQTQAAHIPAHLGWYLFLVLHHFTSGPSLSWSLYFNCYVTVQPRQCNL